MDLPRSNSTASASTGGDNYDDRIGDILNFHYAKLLKIENRQYKITIMMCKLVFFTIQQKNYYIALYSISIDSFSFGHIINTQTAYFTIHFCTML